MNVLVSGGAGYIGSHTVLDLLNNNHTVTVLDNLEHGYLESLDRIKQIAGNHVEFRHADLRDSETINAIFSEIKPESVLHFAAYKSVAEGENEPLKYNYNNVCGTENLLKSMVSHDVERIIFSSTAAVYDPGEALPFKENTRTNPINIYGKSKLKAEQVIRNYAAKYNLKSLLFRYFNVIGAEKSGDMGEDPRSCTNLVPLIMQTLIGKRKEVLLFGDDFNTKDGSQERDYIDVLDLASAHVKGLTLPLQTGDSEIINLSTGNPTSCLEIFKEAEKISDKKLSYRVVEPRIGDPIRIYANNEKAKQILSWVPTRSIQESLMNQWNWTIKNPSGYQY